MSAREFIVHVPPQTFREGWGVWFSVVCDDDGILTDVDSGVVRIAADTTVVIPRDNVPCVQIEENCYYPVDTFRNEVADCDDDTHDLRNRWFATEQEARDHLDFTMSRWRHPTPWESFVRI